MKTLTYADSTRLKGDIKVWGKSLGFQDIRVSSLDLTTANKHFSAWLDKQFHGQMSYMSRNKDKRSQPESLHPGTASILTARMNYLPEKTGFTSALKNKETGYIAYYALGRDYHRVIRQRLNTLAQKINQVVEHRDYRAFTDSAPILERALAENSGLGWIGKNTMLLHRDAGSWFFLGEIFTTLPLPPDEPIKEHCGSCRACIDICPTKAIVAPYQLDARKCISYLTIEYKGSIPLPYRKAIGNRIFGCDDCQIICPWNKFAKKTPVADFTPRPYRQGTKLIDLFAWDEATFLKNTEGSAIRRVGYECWLRNIAVALGNAASSPETIHTLQQRIDDKSDLVREHVRWALAQHL